MSPIALFDLDNTLVDRQGAFHRWAERFVSDWGLPEDAIDALGDLDNDGFASRRVVFDAIRAFYDLPDSSEKLIADYRASYPSYFSPDPEVTEALSTLRSSGWRTGIVTNGPPSQVDKLRRAGILDLIDGYCISDNIGVAKPDRQIFDEAIRRCAVPGINPGVVWMMGDTAAPDIGGGRNAGLRTIWLHRGRRWEVTEYQPDLIVGSVREAIEHLLAK